MNFEKIMKKINASLPLYYIMKNEIGVTDEYLPSLPKDFFFPEAGIDILSDEDCKILLKHCKERNKYINTLQEDTIKYEKECYFTMLYLAPIFDFWFGRLNYNGHEDKHDFEFDILSFNFWEYLRGKISYEKLKQYGENLYKSYMSI